MGLIKAIVGAAGGTMADQWKEFFYCDSLDNNVLVTKGQKQISGRSSNTKGNDNIISNGSGIAVADGQCMIIVEKGKIVEVCAEPGEFTYDTSSEPSIFSGNLGQAVIDTFKTIGKRFTYGGDTGNDQRIYYFNTKEILENKFGTPNPIPFRVVDRNIGLDIDVSVRCSGLYSYKLVNPLLFYTNVCGNVEKEYTRGDIDSQLKTEFISALQPAFAQISEMEVRPNALPAHAEQLSEAMNAALTKKWTELRGISIVSIAMNPITLPEEDAQMIKEAQRIAINRNPGMAAATLTTAQAEAMKAAASNSAGAMTGFMGFGMAAQAGGTSAQNLFEMNARQQQEQMMPQGQQPVMPGAAPAAGAAMAQSQQPSQPAPASAPQNEWICSCGTGNKGKFCMECGLPKPAGAPLYRCDKCGWEPEDPHNPPKFCPECGDPFNDADIQK